jgi:IPT/TIG domain
MKRISLSVLLFVLALPLSAQISAIEPQQLPYLGGTITIRGANLTASCDPEECVPVQVLLEHGIAQVVSASSDRIIATVGPTRIGASHVRVVRQDRTTITTPFVLTFTGNENEETMLLPLVILDRAGAFGSRWATSLSSFPNQLFVSTIPTAVWWRSRFNTVDNAHLRVADLNREDTTWGAELPIVRETDFRVRETIELLDIPADRRFRVSLRLYTVAPLEAARHETTYSIGVFGLDPCCAPLGDPIVANVPAPSSREGLTGNVITTAPGYVEINDFLSLFPESAGARRVRISIFASSGAANPPLYWAFASVTHNATQHVTIVTPAEGR